MGRTFRQFLEAQRAEIAATIYPGETFEGVLSDVMRVSRSARGQGITLCDPRSIIDAVTLAASWPVRIGTDDGAALVITEDTDTPSGKPRLIAMLTARAKLHILSRWGGLRWVNARCVFEGEKFEARQGEDPAILNHEDLTLHPDERGRLCGAYVVGLPKHGLPKVVEVMNRFDIDQIRTEWSREFKDGDLEALEHFQQYAIAKCMHRFVSKLIDLREDVRGWLSEAPPRKPAPAAGTITVPVGNPRAVVDSATVKDGVWPVDPKAPAVMEPAA